MKLLVQHVCIEIIFYIEVNSELWIIYINIGKSLLTLSWTYLVHLRIIYTLILSLQYTKPYFFYFSTLNHIHSTGKSVTHSHINMYKTKTYFCFYIKVSMKRDGFGIPVFYPLTLLLGTFKFINLIQCNKSNTMQ